MERLMSDTPFQTVERVNPRLAKLVAGAQRALRGECPFGPDEVRALRALLAEMAPVIAQSAELRRAQPEIDGPLEVYRSQLVSLQKTVERLRITLLVHRATLEASRTQTSAASRWCAAFRQTR
jgi:hypothetical protein